MGHPLISAPRCDLSSASMRHSGIDGIIDMAGLASERHAR
jgi:hypothetical protein